MEFVAEKSFYFVSLTSLERGKEKNKRSLLFFISHCLQNFFMCQELVATSDLDFDLDTCINNCRGSDTNGDQYVLSPWK